MTSDRMTTEFLAYVAVALGEEAVDVSATGVDLTPDGPRVRYVGVPTSMRPTDRQHLRRDRALAVEACSRLVAIRWRRPPAPLVPPQDSYLRLADAYPDVYTSPTETSAGWHALLVMAAEWMREYGPPQGFVAQQVKSKFGTLRFYYSDDSDDPRATAAAGIIEAVERISRGVCEVCGAPAKLRTRGGWYETVCDEHVR
ncbi:hypothetical protein [Methylobacterium sp. WL6]|uniref:hypothetical protein n=1 Tax=Methylobacterium sp. WL6 TaxID=2603901 RepID=UPI0011CCA08B|nr:hypothetical protein [Methylobacterium sp. WL6]TXN63217.1 hypothetical protein FV230_20480 [Methylobacterium sp. WL6]